MNDFMIFEAGELEGPGAGYRIALNLQKVVFFVFEGENIVGIQLSNRSCYYKAFDLPKEKQAVLRRWLLDKVIQL